MASTASSHPVSVLGCSSLSLRWPQGTAMSQPVTSCPSVIDKVRTWYLLLPSPVQRALCLGWGLHSLLGLPGLGAGAQASFRPVVGLGPAAHPASSQDGLDMVGTPAAALREGSPSRGHRGHLWLGGKGCRGRDCRRWLSTKVAESPILFALTDHAGAPGGWSASPSGASWGHSPWLCHHLSVHFSSQQPHPVPGDRASFPQWTGLGSSHSHPCLPLIPCSVWN